MAGLLAGRQLGMPRCRRSCRSSHAGANPAFRAALPRTQLLCPLNRNVRTLGSGTESSKPACSSGVSGELPTTSAGCGRGASEAHRGWLPCCGCLFLQSNDPSKFLGCPVLHDPYRARTFATSAEALPTAEYFRRPLGTALGDWMADTGGLGRGPSSSRRVLPSSIAVQLAEKVTVDRGPSND